MTWKPHVTVAAVIERDGKFLLVEERAQEGLVYNQPAGHLEPGESLVQAVQRETEEETAWGFRPQALVGIYRWPHPRKDITYLRFAFSGELLRHEPLQPLDEGIVRALWLDYSEIQQLQSQHRSPQVMRCIDDYLAGKRIGLEILQEVLDD